MRSSIIAAAGVFAIGAVADCMSSSDAQRVANNFKLLINDYSNATADRVLTPGFVDYSDSVNELMNNGCPNGPAALGTATFDSRADFEAGQGSQPNIPFDILNIWNNCDTVTMRWRSSAPGTVQPEEPVTGIVVMETSCSGNPDEPWLINTVYSEFNSGAWLYDLGIFKPSCNTSSAKFRRGVNAASKIRML